MPPLAFGGHRHPAHRLDAAGHHHVVVAGHHPGGGEVNRLLGRAALPVDRGGRHVLGQPGRHPGVARDVGALLPHLSDAAPDDIVDPAGVKPVRSRATCTRSRAGRPGASARAPRRASRTSYASVSTMTASRPAVAHFLVSARLVSGRPCQWPGLVSGPALSVARPCQWPGLVSGPALSVARPCQCPVGEQADPPEPSRRDSYPRRGRLLMSSRTVPAPSRHGTSRHLGEYLPAFGGRCQPPVLLAGPGLESVGERVLGLEWRDLAGVAPDGTPFALDVRGDRDECRRRPEATVEELAHPPGQQPRQARVARVLVAEPPDLGQLAGKTPSRASSPD